jgi:Tfp pilus assembly protein PilV
MKNSRSAGYSLIEVLIAMGFLSSVLLSIVGLFYMGRKNVFSGKQMTQAVSLGTRVSEDLTDLDYGQLYAAFGITDATPLGAVDVDPANDLLDDTYTGAILRTTTNFTGAEDPAGFLQRWKDEIQNNNRLQDGYVGLVFSPRQPWDTAVTPPESAALTAGNATVMRIRAIVRWQEGSRRRQVILDTLKNRRPLLPAGS